MMLIAIAEAQRSNREFLEDHLSRWGFESEAFEDAPSLWQRLQEPAPPRVVLLPWDLPGQSALEFCQRLEAEEDVPPVHVVALVERARFHAAFEAMAAGLLDDCVLLPLDAYTLEARLAVARKALALRGRLARTEAERATQAWKDGATGLWNRDACLTFLRREVAGSRRDESTVGAVLLELGGLPQMERVQGFEAGNNVLRAVAENLRTAVRATDWVGRFTEHQLLVILPQSSEGRADSVSHRLARVVRQTLVASLTTVPLDLRYTAAIAHPRDDADRFLTLLQTNLAATAWPEAGES